MRHRRTDPVLVACLALLLIALAAVTMSGCSRTEPYEPTAQDYELLHVEVEEDLGVDLAADDRQAVDNIAEDICTSLDEGHDLEFMLLVADKIESESAREWYLSVLSYAPLLICPEHAGVLGQ